MNPIVTIASVSHCVGLSVVLLISVISSVDLHAEDIASKSVEIESKTYQVKQQDKRFVLSKAYESDGKILVEQSDLLELQPDRVEKVWLDRWWRRGLLMVWRENLNDQYHYTMAVFPHVNENGVVATMWRQEFLVSEQKLDVIAMSGQHRGDGVTIMLGRYESIEGFPVLKTGYLYQNECPNPPMSFTLTPLAPTGKAVLHFGEDRRQLGERRAR